MAFNQSPLDPQLAEQFEQVTKTLARLLPKLLPIAVVVIVALWLGSGVYSVTPGHVGVVRTFGKEVGETDRGGLDYGDAGGFRADAAVFAESSKTGRRSS